MNAAHSSYKERFNVTGHFDRRGKHRFRKVLDISIKGSNKSEVDLMVIMMNPGSSRQQDEYSGVYGTEVPTNHDPTQTHIMYLMEKWRCNHARILNLSDYCDHESEEFYTFLKNGAKRYPAHSIFSREREQELNSLFIENVPVVTGWGVNNVLKQLAHDALDYISGSLILGLSHKKQSWGYYHPQTRPKYLEGKIWREAMLNRYPQMPVKI
jgi:hypothetical protein